MRKIHILSGPAGVGKSTFINDNKNINDIIISSDVIQTELHGELAPLGNKGDVFEEMFSRLKMAIKSNSDADIYYDATNLGRKRRMNIYNHIKSWDTKGQYEVVIDVLHKPYDQIIEQNSQRQGREFVPESKILEMYRSLQIPRIGLDCDSFTINAPDISEYRAEINHRINEPHNSPYHDESLREHIQMTIDGAKASQSEYKDDLVEIATHHDLGKAICRQPKSTNNIASRYIASIYGEHDNYTKHENVGAVYYLIRNKDNLTQHTLDIAEAIQYHMQAHNGFSQKVINNYHINDTVLTLATEFAKIDSQSRVFKSDIFDKYSTLLQIDRDSLLADYVKHAGETVTVSSNWDKNLHTIKYLHGGVDFTDKNLRNARGLTLDNDSNIVTIGFEKFFNYKQIDSYGKWLDDDTFVQTYDNEFIEQRAHIQTDVLDVYEKLDGTFIALGVHNGEFVAAISSSTTTDYSKISEQYFNTLDKSDELKQYLIENNLSLMFEYTSPENLIVIPYDDEHWTLIGARERDFNAPIKSYDDLKDIANKFDLDLVDAKQMTADELFEYQKTNQTSEGFVARNDYGNLIKFKTDYWFEQKNVIGDKLFGDPLTSKKVRDYVDMFINDELDDFIAFKNQHKGPQAFTEIDKFESKLKDFVDDVYKAHNKYKNYSRQDIAKLDIDSNLKDAVFREINGEDWIHRKQLMTRVGKNIAKELISEREFENIPTSVSKADFIDIDALADNIKIENGIQL